MIIYPDLIGQIEELAFNFYLAGVQDTNIPLDLGDIRDIISKEVHKTLNEHITRKYETKRKL